jgi:hypothetical protein
MPVNRTSSYPDLAAAEYFPQRVVDQNRARINQWLARETAERLTLTGYFHGQTTGLLQSRGMLYAGRSAYEVSGVRVILQREPAQPNAFRIYSTYPIEG